MKCPVCGRLFNKWGGQWGYKYDTEYCCSYSCMRAMERRELEELLTDEQKEMIQQYHDQGMDDLTIADRLGLTRKQVYMYQYNRTYKKEKKAAADIQAKPAEIPDHGFQTGRIQIKPQQPADQKKQETPDPKIDSRRVIDMLDRILAIIEQMVKGGKAD